MEYDPAVGATRDIGPSLHSHGGNCPLGHFCRPVSMNEEVVGQRRELKIVLHGRTNSLILQYLP